MSNINIHRTTDNVDVAPPTAPLVWQMRPEPRVTWDVIVARWGMGLIAGGIAWAIAPEWAHTYVTAVGLGLGTLAATKHVLTDRIAGLPVRSYRNHMRAERIVDYLGTAAIEEARRALPNVSSYSPSISTAANAPTEYIDAPEVTVTEAPALPPPRDNQPMIEALRERGHIDRSGHSLLLGYDAQHKPAYIEMDETGFIAVAGHPRTGKTCTTTLLLGQAHLMGWEIVACDKHGNKPDGLLQRVGPIAESFSRTAIEPQQIVKAVDYWYEIVSNRLAAESTQPYRRLLLVIDEFTAMILQELLPPSALHQLISAAVEAPKVQAHGLIIGHQWSERLLGKWGANLRRVITARIVHRADPADAAFLIPSSYAKTAMTLPTGTAIYFGGGNAPTELAIPYVGTRDLEWIADRAPRITASQPTMARITPPTTAARTPLEQYARMTFLKDDHRVAWLAWHTDLGTRRIRELVGCDYNDVVRIARIVRAKKAAHVA